MKTLRIIAGIYLVACFIGAILLLTSTKGNPFLAYYIFINGLIILVGFLFERGRYQPKNTPGQDWHKTGEKFIDTTTGQLTEVHYNAKTGERDYRVTDLHWKG